MNLLKETKPIDLLNEEVIILFKEAENYIRNKNQGTVHEHKIKELIKSLEELKVKLETLTINDQKLIQLTPIIEQIASEMQEKFYGIISDALVLERYGQIKLSNKKEHVLINLVSKKQVNTLLSELKKYIRIDQIFLRKVNQVLETMY